MPKQTAPKTQAQHDRSTHRDQSGRMIANPCELCGKAAPMAYYSAGSWTVLDRACSWVVETLEEGGPDGVKALEDAQAIHRDNPEARAKYLKDLRRTLKALAK